MNKNGMLSIVSLSALSLSLVTTPAYASGAGFMIAIIVTSDDPALESDLAQYSVQHGLPACTIVNGCLEVARPFGMPNPDPSSRPDVSFYVEQAHQANPAAKILVVEAKSISWQDKWEAANYAKTLPQVEKVSSVSYSKVVMEIGLVLKQS